MRHLNLLTFIVSLTFLAGSLLAQDTTMTINSNGKVGIGTTTPFGKLEVVGDGTAWHEGFLFLKNINNDAGIRIYDASDSIKYHIFNANFFGDLLRIVPDRVYGNGGINLTQDGLVGIGTLTPASKLEVTGTIHSTSGGIKFPDGTVQSTASGSGLWQTTGSKIYYNSGAVGVGTTNPAGDLEVVDNGSTNNVYFTAYNDLVLGGTLGLQKARGSLETPANVQNNDRLGTVLGLGKAGFSFWSTSELRFEVDGTVTSDQRPPSRITLSTNSANSSATERMRIDNNGNVGIGTTNPQGTLDVNGPIYQSGGVLHADYVFAPDYQLESIKEHTDFMWKNKHLKAIPKARLNEMGQEAVEVGSHRKGIVEELEKAHIYIDELNNRISNLEEKLEKLAILLDDGNKTTGIK